MHDLFLQLSFISWHQSYSSSSGKSTGPSWNYLLLLCASWASGSFPVFSDIWEYQMGTLTQRSQATSISLNGHLASLLLWQYGFRSSSCSFRLISVSRFSPSTFCDSNWPRLCSWDGPDTAEQIRSSLRYQRAERRQVREFLRRRRYRISKSFSTECFTDYVGRDRAWKCIQATGNSSQHRRVDGVATTQSKYAMKYALINQLSTQLVYVV